MWQEIKREEYVNLSKGKDLKPIESFSDILGILECGKGYPYMETIWGIKKIPIVKSEMSKANSEQKEWNYSFYKYLTPQ